MKASLDRTKTFIVLRGPIPSVLASGVIYVNPMGSRAHHLCACGCGCRVMTPLNDWEWRLSGSVSKPSLSPSVGNWNLECHSHYWVKDGKVVWARRWSQSEIAEGRAKEQEAYLKTNWLDSIRARLKQAANFIFGRR